LRFLPDERVKLVKYCCRHTKDLNIVEAISIRNTMLLSVNEAERKGLFSIL